MSICSSVCPRLGLKVFVVVVGHSCQLLQFLHEILNSAENRVVFVFVCGGGGGGGCYIQSVGHRVEHK